MHTETNVRISIGDQIRKLRELNGLSQQELGEMIGIKQTTISKIESGKFNASIEMVSKIISPIGGKLTIIK